jgi:hypothetical protein
MKQFVFAAALVAALGALDIDPARAQGCAGGMCALPGAATSQPQQQAAPSTGMMGGMGMMGMCPCCRQMAMMQPNPQSGLRPMPMDPGAGGDMGGMGSTPRPPAGAEPVPGTTPPAQ